MKTIQNAALLIAGVLIVNSQVFAKNGADDNSGTAGTSGSAGTFGTAGTSGTAGTTGTSGTAGTAGTTGTTGTSGTSGTFGSANLNKKILANFGEQLLVVPCIEVKNSLFNGYYHVAFGLSGDNSGNDWSVKEVKNSTAETCASQSAPDVSTLELLQAIGLSGTSGTSGLNKKVIADFSDKLLVLPCVDVKSSASNGYYHVVMNLVGDNSGSSWKLKAVSFTSSDACEYNATEDISTDALLQANGLSSVEALKHK